MVSEVATGAGSRAVWVVYLLRRVDMRGGKSEGQGSRLYYVGITNNLNKRTIEHNKGKSPATKGYLWELVASANCKNRTEAALVECWMKAGETRKKRERFIELYAADAQSEDVDKEVFVKRAALWKASQQLRTGIFKGVRGNV